MRTWADAVQKAYSTFPAPTVPDLAGAVDKYFDLAQQVLDQQRSFAHQFVSAGTDVAGSLSEQAGKAAEQYTAQVVTVTEQAAAATADATTNGTRTAARNAKAAANS